MPFAIAYTLFEFILVNGPLPFQKRRVFYIKIGKKWPYSTGLKTNLGDETEKGCYIIRRNQTTYALKSVDYINLHTIDVKKPDLYCTERDLLGGNLYIINKVEFGEALEAYLKPEYKEEVLEMRVLLYPSEEINKNLMRLFSIIPLLLQANRLKNLSIAFSIIIVVIDIFSNIVEKRWWVPTKLKLKNFIRSHLAKVEKRSLRSSISKYLSSISLSLLHCDDFTCSFKKVVPEEIIWIVPNTYLHGCEVEGVENYCYAPIKEYEELLEKEDDSFIEKHNEGQKSEGRQNYFSIPKGSLKYAINTKQGLLKCIFVPKHGTAHGMAYNFLNDVELHWGPYFPEYTSMIISFLNEISRLDYLPFTMSIKKTYHTEGYDRVFDHVAKGGWFMMAKAIHEGFVS